MPFLSITLFSLIEAEEFSSISTGRPGVANPTSSISKGLYQFEIGIKTDLKDNLAYPLFFRTGIMNSTEIQIGCSDNLSVGILYGDLNIIKQLEQSFIVTVSLSENNEELTSTDLYLPFSISSNIPVWGQVAASFPTQGDPSFSYALATGGGFGEKMGWFVELYGNITTEEQEIDAGSTYLINNTMQVDFSGGVSLENTNSKFVEVGFSFRLPK